MRVALKIIVVVIAGALLGLAATWAVIVRGTMGGDIVNGPWRTSLLTGSAQSGPYLRAAVALHGLLALNRSETIYYTATSDSDGAPLDGACTYRIAGRDPPTRWWSITAYGADDFLIPNAAKRYAVSKNSVARGGDGGFVIVAAKDAPAVNGIALADGRFTLTLRLYNPEAQVAADPAHVTLPVIAKEHCT
jgi:hypothetical protein